MTRHDADQFIAQCIDQAQNRIAPTWPLDQFIAVNPYWGWAELPFPVVAKKLRKLANAPLTMPAGYFQAQWNSRQFTQSDLHAAVGYADKKLPIEDLEQALHTDDRISGQPILITRLIDQQRDLSHAVPWQQFVKHQISQHCAAYFDHGQAKWHPTQSIKLYDSWKRHTALDRGPLLQFGTKHFEQLIQQLPSGATNLIQMVLPQIGIAKEHWSDYLTALLIDINGWAAWCAYLQWQARLRRQSDGETSDQIVQLIAIRLAWEWVLLQQYPAAREALLRVWAEAEMDDTALESECQADQALLHAMEHAYQTALARDLLRPLPVAPATADFQAVFCIDVRSEIYRRALEASHSKLQTFGFAGFFGLPIAYRERGTVSAQPRLPGLLAPKYWVSEQSPAAEVDTQNTLRDKNRWQEMRQSASSAFTFVETLGLTYGAKLVRSALAAKRTSNLADRTKVGTEPALMLYSDASLSTEVSLSEQAVLVKQVLSAMGLRNNFARLVLLVGHGTACVNNPHAASLECGACGGQNGSINVRLLSGLLNNPALRDALRQHQITIPDSTWFIAALHNTTTDQVQLYNLDSLPQTHAADLAQVQGALATASQKSRAERAAALGIDHAETDDVANASAFESRSVDWAQIRPEWGLVNNAAFIIAPRRRSSALDLQGRAFLNDYDWQSDPGSAVLEQIMSGPMVVGNWINMQYYASSVDPQRYGSGSKILHNVVGQRLGVFEGNGGDLRIGLPWQSVHNGAQLMHTPLRLSVLIEAPREAIDSILDKHQNLKQLVENRWLHLFQIDARENQIYYRNQQQWMVFAGDPSETKANSPLNNRLPMRDEQADAVT